MKRKILEKILIIVAIIVSIVSVQKYSNAVYLGFSQSDNFTVIFNGYDKPGDLLVFGKPGNDTFCIDAPGDIYALGEGGYKVLNYVHIEGRKSTVWSGNRKTPLGDYTSDKNLVMAWILAQGDRGSWPLGYNGASMTHKWSPTPEWPKLDEYTKYSDKQNAVYGYVGTWKKATGLNNVYTNNVSKYQNIVRKNSTWEKNAKTYVSNYTNNKMAEVKNTSEKKAAVKSVEVLNNESRVLVGPFKVEITAGDLDYIKVYNGKNQISSVKFAKYEGTKLKEISPTKSEINKKYFYILVPVGVEKIDKIEVGVKGARELLTADIWILSKDKQTRQNIITTWTDKKIEEKNISINILDEPIYMVSELNVIKVDEDNEKIKLKGVEFKFQNQSNGKYVKQTNGKIEYVDEEKDATIFKTNENGEIKIENLIIGQYKAYEVSNPNYGYELPKEGKDINVTAEVKDQFITNKQKWIKLSGYVWNDRPLAHKGNEESKRNDLWQEGDADKDEKNGDKRMEGVTVRLKNKKTNEIVTINGEKAEKKTDKNGEYQFVDVLIEELENYYIEFEYDGLVYKNVEPHLDKDNGSKSLENETVRTNFNDSFSYIEDNGNQADNIGQARNSKGEVSHNDLYYNKETGKSSLDHSKSVYNITANTNEAGYSIKDQYKAGMEEIKYINLGLQDREQPDLFLGNDLYNAIVSVNGYSHTYWYRQNYNDAGEFNVGVAFGTSPGGNKYRQPIYRADVQTAFDNPDNELKVYATYELQVINEATTLKSRVNRIADYYDTNYELIEVGTNLDEKTGAITGKLENYSEKYNDKYNKLTINTSDTNMINGVNDSENTLNIYIRFRVNRDRVEGLFLNEAPLKNIAEIESYSTFDTNGKIYAGIDKDSAPGNIIPGEESTHEDDDFMTPSFVLYEADARSMTGSVFEDIKGLNSENSALGDGIYNNTEQGIAGIEVKITTSETGNDNNKFTATTETDQNGNYTFVGPYKDEVEGRFTNFIPGKYTIEFTWGGKTYTKSNGETTTYTVQKYKGTTQPKDEWNRKNTNLDWYKTTDPRYTDAIDNYNTRKEIDEDLETIVYENAISIDTTKKMTATTALMELGIEINSTNTMEDKFEYKITNIDYGIIKRPDQDIELNKRVSTVKLTLANGQVLIDATIGEDHSITGEKRNLKYIVNPKPGQIHIELDNELMQGSTLEVGYEFKATNIGQEDYQYDKYTDYYNFGISGTEEDKLVTITPAAIIDYLDRDWGYNETINTQWSELTQEDIKTKTLEGTSYKMFAPEVYKGNDTDTDIANTRILYTEALKNEKLKPATATRTADSATTNLVVSKLLTTSDDIRLSNQTEVVEITKTGGGVPISTPGNFVPGTTPIETTDRDDSESEDIIVTPPTGADNMTYVIYTAIGVLALAILGTGIVVIKKKILK